MVLSFFVSNIMTVLGSVMEFSEKAWQFCADKGEPNRIAYLTSLAVEEMAKNVIEHGFSKDKKKHLLIRIEKAAEK